MLFEGVQYFTSCVQCPPPVEAAQVNLSGINREQINSFLSIREFCCCTCVMCMIFWLSSTSTKALYGIMFVCGECILLHRLLKLPADEHYFLVRGLTPPFSIEIAKAK